MSDEPKFERRIFPDLAASKAAMGEGQAVGVVLDAALAQLIAMLPGCHIMLAMAVAAETDELVTTRGMVTATGEKGSMSAMKLAEKLALEATFYGDVERRVEKGEGPIFDLI